MDYLKELTDAQLRGVLSSLDAKIREARTKATRALVRRPDLSKAWVNNLSAVAADTAEMAALAREERRKAFEKALVESPDAFVLYHTSVYLQTLQQAVRGERVARSKK